MAFSVPLPSPPFPTALPIAFPFPPNSFHSSSLPISFPLPPLLLSLIVRSPSADKARRHPQIYQMFNFRGLFLSLLSLHFYSFVFVAKIPKFQRQSSRAFIHCQELRVVPHFDGQNGAGTYPKASTPFITKTHQITYLFGGEIGAQLAKGCQCSHEC